MPSERDIDNYINEIEEKNQIYIEEELEYAEKCHKLEERVGCPLDVREKAFDNGFYDIYGNHYICEHYVPYLKSMHTRGIMRHIEKHFNLEDYKKTWWLKKDRSE